MELKRLTDDDLWKRMALLATDERKITLEILLHLKEVDRRGLHLKRGHPSLYEYAVRELKYAEGAAYRRVQSMRFIRDVPEAEGKIQTGELNLTTAAKVQNISRTMPQEKKVEILNAVQGQPGREVDRKLTQWQPKTSREFTRWLSADEIQLTLLLDKPVFKTLEDLKAIKSHSSPTYSEVVKDLIKLGNQKWNPLQHTAPPQQGSRAQSKSAVSRYIPNNLRIEVWRRHQNQCSFIDPQTGNRCTSKHYLQIDHILPVALGGKSTLENLRLLCQQHNLHRAKETFGENKLYLTHAADDKYSER
jgi:5-methylcytosine-specific restriction endonuclease McrA